MSDSNERKTPYLSVHQPARHQYRLVHGIDCLDKLLHGVEDALVRELLVVMPGDPSQAVPARVERERERNLEVRTLTKK